MFWAKKLMRFYTRSGSYQKPALYMYRLCTYLQQYCWCIIYNIQGGPKSKPLPIFQKIILKIANEIRFLRKVWIKYYNAIRWL